MSIAEQSQTDRRASVDLTDAVRAPAEVRRRTDRLLGKRDDRVSDSRRLAGQFDELNRYLALAGKVTVALEQLSEQLFERLLDLVQQKLTVALQEILEQPIEFRAEAGSKRGAATVEFWIERDGKREDVLDGQGGSVANILSVGLRIFALTTLGEDQHRRFVVLDEQDCWLRPDLVPRLVKIVYEAGKALGFQVLLISHHDVALFERFADRIYQFIPCPDGSVEVSEVCTAPPEPDQAA